MDTKTVVGMPYDLPMVGYGGHTVNTLRLWSAKAAEEFDLDDFNRGSYVDAVANKVLAENLTKVLYPNDNVFEGKELRLKQQYFFVSCSIQDILRRFKTDGNDWDEFPDKAFIQLNDTHPSLVIPELMRLLIDREGLGWDQAWRITTGIHRLHQPHHSAGGAGEVARQDVRRDCSPGICRSSTKSMPGLCGMSPRAGLCDGDRLRRMSIIDEDGEKYVRMAHLAIVGSCSVNGVAKLHTRASEERGAEGFCRIVAGEIQQQNQRHHPAALAPQRQSAAGPSDYRIHRRRLDHRFGSASEAGTVRGRRLFSASDSAPPSSRTRRCWPSSSPAKPGSTFRPTRCSMFKSSGCTSTSANCCWFFTSSCSMTA